MQAAKKFCHWRNAIAAPHLLRLQSREEDEMKFALFGVAAVTAIGLVAPVKAQEVIYNPGYCAQFYPNANCQNKGPAIPIPAPTGPRIGGIITPTWDIGGGAIITTTTEKAKGPSFGARSAGTLQRLPIGRRLDKRTPASPVVG
jgi:hypothetical protein